MSEHREKIVDLNEYRARCLIDDGLDEVHAGNFEGALKRFRASLALRKSAEAHTYVGWMLNSLGEPDRAIEECEKAIAIDPDFGNPYNDIGSYLLQKGCLNEAVRWFYRALDAPNYATPQWPHINLGKLYLSKRLLKKALYHFHQALELDPGNRALEFMILELEERMH